jgi:hypothetical protein
MGLLLESPGSVPDLTPALSVARVPGKFPRLILGGVGPDSPKLRITTVAQPVALGGNRPRTAVKRPSRSGSGWMELSLHPDWPNLSEDPIGAGLIAPHFVFE